MRNPWEDERVQLGAIALASVSIVAFLTSLASQTLPETERPVVAPAPAKRAEAPKNPIKQDFAPPVAEAPPNTRAESPPGEGAPPQDSSMQEQARQEQARQERARQEPAREERPLQEQSPQASPQKETASQDPSQAARHDDEVVAAIRPSLPLEAPAPARSPDTAAENRSMQEPAAAAPPAERRALKKRKPVFVKPLLKRKTWVGALPNHKSNADEPAGEGAGLQLLY